MRTLLCLSGAFTLWLRRRAVGAAVGSVAVVSVDRLPCRSNHRKRWKPTPSSVRPCDWRRSHAGRQQNGEIGRIRCSSVTWSSYRARRITAHYGIVQGSTKSAKHVGKDIFAGLKNIVGGELKGYTELMQERDRKRWTA